MRKPLFTFAITKAQISYAVTSQLISAFVFHYIHVEYSDNSFTSYIRNVKPLIIYCGCTVRFVSDLVGNPEERFSNDAAQLIGVRRTQMGFRLPPMQTRPCNIQQYFTAVKIICN